MELIRKDDTEKVFLHKSQCNRQSPPGVPAHLAHEESYVEQERQEDGQFYPVTKTRWVEACETSDDQWVKVKRRLSKGDTDAIAGAMYALQVRVEPNGRSTQEMTFGSTEYRNVNIAGLLVGITDWSFSDALTRKDIENLANEDAELIVEQSNLLWNPPRSDDERKNSSSPSAPPYETASLPLNNSGG